MGLPNHGLHSKVTGLNCLIGETSASSDCFLELMKLHRRLSSIFLFSVLVVKLGKRTEVYKCLFNLCIFTLCDLPLTIVCVP